MDGRWEGLDDLGDSFGPSSVTIGNFDGVHRGHCKILRTVAELARDDGLTSVALTFDPHPLAVVAPAKAPKSLTSILQRAALIREEGIDKVVVMRFTPEIASLSPRGFVERVLVRSLRAARVTVGANFRFGQGQSGTTNTLRALGSEFGFTVGDSGIVTVGGVAVSSTRVRELVGCMLVAPLLCCVLWMNAFGGTAVSQYVDHGYRDVVSAVQAQQPEIALFAMLDALPLANLTSSMAIVLVVIFFVTSSDSGSLVIDTITAGGKLDAPVVQRAFWCTLEGIVAIALLLGGGLVALQAAVITTGFPFSLALVAMCYSTWRGLRTLVA